MAKKATRNVGRLSPEKPSAESSELTGQIGSYREGGQSLNLGVLPDMKRAKNFSASDAKTKLGQVIDFVAAGGVATITRRGRQRFAVMRLETVEALVNIVTDYQLESLGGRYDALIAKMQTAESKSAIDALFFASPEEIGAAAANAAGAGGIGTAVAAKQKTEQVTSASGRASAKTAPH